MSDSNYQKIKTDPHATTAHANVTMHSMSSMENEKRVILSRKVTQFIVQYSTQQRVR